MILIEGFRQISFYLPEQFRQISFYLPEEFRQISSYLPEEFRQISSYLPEEFRQITSSKKIWELRFELLLIIWRVGNTYPRMRQDLEIHGQMWHIIPNYLRFEIWFLKSMISFYSIFSLYIQECTLSLTIWELRFEFLVCDSFLLSLFHIFWWIRDFGSKFFWELRFEILLVVWLVVSSYHCMNIYGSME